MPTHRAAVKPSQEDAFTIKDLPSPRATPESVVVKVLATSIVPFMKEVMDGGRGYPIAYPIVPGALAIARLVEVGSDAVSLSPDQLCFCDITIRGRDDPNVSILMGLHGGAFGAPHMKLMEGEWHHGTYSQLAKFPLENVLPLDEDILIKQKGYTFEDLCYLGACMVPFGGLSDIGVKSGEHVIVAPATGKFGGAAVSAAIALGAVVIAAGRNEGVLGRLKAAYDDTGRFKSVTLSGQLDKDNAALLAATPQGMGADAYIDFSPPAAAKSTHIAAAMNAMKAFGRVALMGGIVSDISILYPTVMFKSLRLFGRLMYDRSQIRSVIALAETGNLVLGRKVGVEVHGPYGLDQIQDALENAAGSTNWGSHVVLKP